MFERVVQENDEVSMNEGGKTRNRFENSSGAGIGVGDHLHMRGLGRKGLKDNFTMFLKIPPLFLIVSK